MENDRKASGGAERYDLEILLRRPSLRSNLPRRVSQICREVSTGETNCGVGCIRGPWLQSFAKRNSFTLIYGILGSFYGSYYAYFYGVISTLEKRFKISSQTAGTIAAVGDIAEVLMCLFISQCMPRVHRPKWVGFGVLLTAASTTILTLPHFLYEPQEPRNMLITTRNTDVRECADEPEVCHDNLKDYIPIIILILAKILHGIGSSLYLMVGRSYEYDNIEKYKPPALLSLLAVLKILGPAFGYWLSSISLKFSEYPELTPFGSENDPRWAGAWWLGSLVIGFVLIVLGFLINLFPTTLPKTAVTQIQNKLNEIPVTKPTVSIRKGELIFKRIFNSPNISCTHFSTVFNVLGFLAYFIFLPKYVEIQYRVPASTANFIAGSVTLISSAIGIVTANSVITRYLPSARALATWTVIVGIISIGCLVSYIFLDCPANDEEIKVMVTQHLDTTCKCTNSSFFPVCDEYNQAFISLCHAGCENILNVNSTKDHETCTSTTTRKVFKGFCPIDCHSSFLKFIIITCMTTFIYATGRTSNYWFETKFEKIREKPEILSLGMILGFVVSIPVPLIFGYLLDQACLLWEGNCDWSGNCWLYDNEKLRFNMNLTAVIFAMIGILFDVGIWFSVKNLELFDDIGHFIGESDEI